MRIKFVEVSNFRKLRSVRIEFADKTTVLVGANNSGKTSAMVALGHFLVDHRRFSSNDITLSNWKAINPIGTRWLSLAAGSTGEPPSIAEWRTLLPCLDLWLEVPDSQLYLVSHLVPTLDWAGGLIGVRLQMEPDDPEQFSKEYIAAIKAAQETKEAANKAAKKDEQLKVSLWPGSMREFLDRRILDVMTVRTYPLDVAKLQAPDAGVALTQQLDVDAMSIDGAPVKKLVCVDEVQAERNMGVSASRRRGADGAEADSRRKLSEQLRAYYKKHLDPSDFPEPSDVSALDAIEKAQIAFDEKLALGFKAPLEEIEGLGYPGVSDPKVRISTRLRPLDAMNHEAAVRYEIPSTIDAAIAGYLRLPEDYNGLGYQNLIYIVFKLMSFRDEWMQVGKLARKVALESRESTAPCPLHLVLVEEPEAHLHAQVQQVFVRKAYDVLRKHESLGAGENFYTQLLISTHSSHIAYECEFSWLRYFRRLPSTATTEIPTAAVVNLSEVFGTKDDTQKFVARYLRATHCDLFFADAAVLVEGPAERMLVPHFMRFKHDELRKRYVTLLEIGGSHAHRLRPLIDHLGLTSLVISDLDPGDGDGKSVLAARGQGQVTLNPTLKNWVPNLDSIDSLFDEKSQQIELKHAHGNSVMAVYQVPILIKLAKGAKEEEYIAYTFEDSLVAENLKLFEELKGSGLIAQFQKIVSSSTKSEELAAQLQDALKKGNKAQFACDILSLIDPVVMKVPSYIERGLNWLGQQLKVRDLSLGLEKPVETDKAAG